VDRMLSTVANRRGSEGSLPPPVLRRPLAHASHTFSPGWGKVSFRDLQAHPCGSPRARAFERASAFFTCELVIPCLDLTTQARPQARSAWSVARAVCLARAYAGRSASTASTTESSWREAV
jgi:hypothetical protein